MSEIPEEAVDVSDATSGEGLPENIGELIRNALQELHDATPEQISALREISGLPGGTDGEG